jgi:hypothetical protein
MVPNSLAELITVKVEETLFRPMVSLQVVTEQLALPE